MASKGALSKQMESLQKEEVLQAVIICDNFNCWFEPVSLTLPTPLIPVVNTPILEYTLEFLALSGVQEVILFCCSHADKMKSYIKNSKWSDENSSLVLNVIVSESCRSLGDAMRDLDAKSVIRSDFILLSGDVIANIQLIPILELHRKFVKQDQGAVMTLLYKEAGLGHNSRSPEDETVLAVDSSTNRILFHKKVGRGCKRIHVPLEIFTDRAKSEVLYNLQETQISICSPVVPPLFSDNFDFQSLDDFIRGILINEEILSSTIYLHRLDTSEYASRITTWHMYQAVSRDVIHRWVYPLVPDVAFSASRETYMYLRHNIYLHKSVKLAKGCTLEEDVVLGANTSVGEDTYISCSVIGKNCRIGKNVKISNSFIWDSTVLEDNCCIESSVVAESCIIRSGCKVWSGCIFGPGTELGPENDMKAVCLVSSCSDEKGDSETRGMRIGEKAFRYVPHAHDSDSEEEGKAYQPSGLVLESENESEAESDESGSDEGTYRGSPVPDDINLFFNEVSDSLGRGLEEKLKCDHLILEINASRYAYNVSVQEVNYHVVRALISLSSTSNSFSDIKRGLTYFMPVLKNYIRNEETQEDCLRAIEDTISSKSALWESLPKLLHMLYESDVLDEDAIIKWYYNFDATSPSASAIRKEVEPLIRWLEEDVGSETDSSGEHGR